MKVVGGSGETADPTCTFVGWKMDLVGGNPASTPDGPQRASVLGVRPDFSYSEEEDVVKVGRGGCGCRICF